MTRARARRRVLRILRRTAGCVLGALLAAVPLGAWAAEAAAAAAAPADANAEASVEFDPNMLAGGKRHAADLTRFERGNPIAPGTYDLDVYLNHDWVGRLAVRFAAPSASASAVPCVTDALLARMGLVPVTKDVQARAGTASADACTQLGDLIPDATLDPDMSELRLDASVPQAYTHPLPRGYVNPQSWDAGVPAGLLNYNLNAYHSASHGADQTNLYLGLNAGLNLGHWHFRQDSTVTWQSASGGPPAQRHWQAINTYVRRDLPKLRATLTAGDSYTDGAVFDSLGVRGVQLATDDRMLPDSLRGYAPVIQGVADTNARVTVRQNGVEIYQTTVAPGPFVIKDLYPTGYGGDLEVTVTEADGRRHAFSVPYASVAQLLRPGITRFDVAVGQLRDTGMQAKPGVVQATWQRGFSNLVTGYAGVQGSEGYAAALAGAAFNTRLGALALDLTQAHTRIPNQPAHDGQSFRITYSKIIPETDTSLTVAAYRYSTSGFFTLLNAESARDYVRRGVAALQYLPANLPMIDGVPVLSLLTPEQRALLAGTAYDPNNAFAPRGLLQQRDRFTLTLSQRLGNTGASLYATASINDYWNRTGRDSQFQIGYSNHLKRVAYGVSVSRGRTQFGGFDNQIYFNASVPLGRSTHAPSLSVNLTHDDQAGMQEQATVSGSAGQWNQFIYGATASHAGSGGGSAFSLNGGYNGPYAVLNASAGTGSGYSQESFGASGAVVVHPGGITFGQPLGDTSAIVHVPGARGAHVINAPGLRVDRAGYALVPYLVPYQLDTIEIDPQGLPLGVQLEATSAQVAPYAGAVVMVDFKSKAGRALLVRVHQADGAPVPFGAEVFDAQGDSAGVVGQGGLALLRSAGAAGRLTVKWNAAHDEARACSFAYALPARAHAAAAPIDAACTITRTVPAGHGGVR